MDKKKRPTSSRAEKERPVKKKAVAKKRPPKKRKRTRKKIYSTKPLRVNLVTGFTNIIALLISILFILNASSIIEFQLTGILSIIFVLFFTEDLLVNIYSLYETKQHRLPFQGQICGIIAALLMLAFPSLGAIPAALLYLISAILIFQKHRYLVSPKRRKVPIFKNPAFIVAIITALLFGGIQTYAAIKQQDTDEQPSNVVKTSTTTEATTFSLPESSASEESSDTSSESTTESTTTATTASSEEAAPDTSESSAAADTAADNTDFTKQVGDLAIEVSNLVLQSELRQGELAYTPEEAHTFALVYLTIKNTGSEDVSFSTHEFSLTDSQDEFDLVDADGIDSWIEDANLVPGTSLTGFIAYEVPSDVDTASLRLECSIELDANGESFVFLLPSED